MLGPSFAVALALALPVATPAPPSPTAHAARKECKPEPTIRRVPRRVLNTNVSCLIARRVAVRVSSNPPRGCVKMAADKDHVRWVGPCRRMGYRCTGHTILEGRIIDATCRDGRKVVRFQF